MSKSPLDGNLDMDEVALSVKSTVLGLIKISKPDSKHPQFVAPDELSLFEDAKEMVRSKFISNRTSPVFPLIKSIAYASTNRLSYPGYCSVAR